MTAGKSKETGILKKNLAKDSVIFGEVDDFNNAGTVRAISSIF